MNSEVNEGSDPKMTKPSLLTRVKKMNKQNKERSQAAFSNMFGGGNPADKLSIRNKGVAEATGDPKFDKMLKGITGKRQVAKQQKADTKQQARDAFGSMFGGGNPADKLSIRKNTRMDEKKQDITQQMADKAKKDNITQSDKEKLSKLATMMKKEETTDSERMDENDDYYGSRDSMSKKEFKRREMEHELGNEDGRKRKSYYSKPKSYKANTPAVSVKKEEAELTFEEMTPAQKAERLRMITKAADRVQSGAAEKSVKKLAKKDMKSPGAQRGMAPLKKEVDEQIQILRKTIVEGTAREKISAYKELNNLIQEKLKGEE